MLVTDQTDYPRAYGAAVYHHPDYIVANPDAHPMWVDCGDGELNLSVQYNSEQKLIARGLYIRRPCPPELAVQALKLWSKYNAARRQPD